MLLFSRLIKLSSPNLNYLIGAGAIVLYVDIYLLVAPSTNLLATRVLCTLTPWLTAIGYSLCYGTIVVKMVRVHYIFSNPKPNTCNHVRELAIYLSPLSYSEACSCDHLTRSVSLYIDPPLK